MERGFSHERYSEFDAEHEPFLTELEQTPEKEKTEAELLLEAFESGKRFDDEDEKARDYNARLDQADTYNNEITQINEQISQVTTQLASLPLTPEQLVLLDEIENLMAERSQVKDPKRIAVLDNAIETKTKQLARVPTTPDQGELLDSILEMIDAREVAEFKLQRIFEEVN